MWWLVIGDQWLFFSGIIVTYHELIGDELNDSA